MPTFQWETKGKHLSQRTIFYRTNFSWCFFERNKMPDRESALKLVTKDKPQGNLTGHVHKLTKVDNAKGGKRGQETLRKRLAQKRALETILSLKVKNKKLVQQMKDLGIDDENLINEYAIAISQFIKAVQGDTNAYKAILDRVDGQPKSEIELSGSVASNRPYEGMTKEELKALLKK